MLVEARVYAISHHSCPMREHAVCGNESAATAGIVFDTVACRKSVMCREALCASSSAVCVCDTQAVIALFADELRECKLGLAYERSGWVAVEQCA